LAEPKAGLALEPAGLAGMACWANTCGAGPGVARAVAMADARELIGVLFT
jgi:hypothetical protein